MDSHGASPLVAFENTKMTTSSTPNAPPGFENSTAKATTKRGGYAAALRSSGVPCDTTRAVSWPTARGFQHAHKHPHRKPDAASPPRGGPKRPPSRTRVYRPVLADDSPSLVLVDTVNAFFAWYFRTLRVYNRARHRSSGATVPADDTAGMNSLKAAFETTFRRNVDSILALTGAARQDIVFATDCQRARVWRNDVLRDATTNKPLYKAQRNTRKDAGIPVVMRFLYDDLLPRLMPRRRLGAPRAEADDVIGVITRLVNARAPARRVFIISDDSDFLQLLDYPMNEIYSQRFRRQRDKYPRSAQDYMRMKILMGDKIDNIDAAFPRCGPKTAEALIGNPKLMAAKIEKYGSEKLDRNRMLIDFDMIPANVRSTIIERALLLCHRSKPGSPTYASPRSPYFQKMVQNRP